MVGRGAAHGAVRRILDSVCRHMRKIFYIHNIILESSKMVAVTLPPLDGFRQRLCAQDVSLARKTALRLVRLAPAVRIDFTNIN
jgi:hypothetical protein